MAFDPRQYDRMTADGWARARLDELEEEGRKQAMLPRRRGARPPGQWLAWFLLATVIAGFIYWFVGGLNSAPPPGDDFGLLVAPIRW